mmetsp:Transcript_35884/g.64634  ORF Transcript_35884/g.64634 Transcript_35884/m.64634 type:complete len:125 (+) Transcript_35884:1487-1861(+)
MFNATNPIPPADCVVVEVEETRLKELAATPKEEETKDETTTDDTPEEETPDMQSSNENTSDDNDDNGLSTGALVGIFIGSIALISLLVGVMMKHNISKSKNEKEFDQVYDKNVVDDKSSIASGV